MAILTVMFLWRQPVLAPENSVLATRTAVIGGSSFVLEVAETQQARAKGLSDREALAADAGMLFVFEQPGKSCFWMKDTLIPLDMLWLDDSYKLVHLEKSVSPESFPQSFCSAQEARYVVELRAGTAEKLGLKLGDVLTLN